MPTSLLRSINVFPSSILPRKTSPSVISARTNGLSCSVNKTGRFYAEIVTVQYTQQTSIPRKHNRFLLTGAKLSATSSVYMSSSSSVTSSGDLVPDSKPQKHPPQQSIKKPVSAAPVSSNPPTVPSTSSTNTVVNKGGDNLVTSEGIWFDDKQYYFRVLDGDSSWVAR
ncbi:hypothetical protein OIU77_020161 [Salix suchowensis]|uniref:Uncharacterized protein n=1 Tax=Salix suchowensis TaxID=1278906 RepID=A0ABQ9CIK8_9ROSI|nr:hypothetical protein OIU77_020161 [Salix suchowensis]